MRRRQLAGAVFSEIDELILKINPVLLGSGIPLVSGELPETALTLIDTQRYANGFMLMRYSTDRSGESFRREDGALAR